MLLCQRLLLSIKKTGLRWKQRRGFVLSPSPPFLQMQRTYFHRWSLPPASQLLPKSILGPNTSMIVNSVSDKDQLQVYREKVFADLNEELPEELPVRFTDMKSYQRSLASFVVEEAICTVLSSLDAIVESLKKRQRKSVHARITHENGDNQKYECFTYDPLQPYYRRELKAGTVVLLLPKGATSIIQNLTLAILRRGSIKSSRSTYRWTNGTHYRDGVSFSRTASLIICSSMD
jgi:hypothetical protein